MAPAGVWLRVVGGTVAVACSSAAGSLCARAYSDRPAQLRAFAKAMSMLETEVGFLLTRMPEAFQRLARRTRQPVSGVFERAGRLLASGDGLSAASAWEMALADSWEDVALTREEVLELTSMGACLGASDCQDQVRKIRAAARRLDELAARAEEDARRNARLVRYMGFAAGVTSVLLFA